MSNQDRKPRKALSERSTKNEILDAYNALVAKLDESRDEVTAH